MAPGPQLAGCRVLFGAKMAEPVMLPPASTDPTQWWGRSPRHAVNPRPGQAEPQGAAEKLRLAQCALQCQYWGTP